MLKGLHPLLSADMLYLLARMGHGDDLAIVDGNFPAESIASATPSRTLLRLPGLRVDKVLEAVMTVFPLDDFTDDPLRVMQVVGNAAERPEAVRSMETVALACGHAGAIVSLARQDFYDAARCCFGIIQCGEQRLYGNIILRKGVVRQDT
jgi:L-fucose mutarotase